MAKTVIFLHYEKDDIWISRPFLRQTLTDQADSGDKRQGGGARPTLKVSGRSVNRARTSSHRNRRTDRQTDRHTDGGLDPLMRVPPCEQWWRVNLLPHPPRFARGVDNKNRFRLNVRTNKIKVTFAVFNIESHSTCGYVSIYPVYKLAQWFVDN